jgi:predicted nucleic acid-binding protein
MTGRCVDASVAVKWAVKGEPYRAKARALLRDSGKLGITLIAPPSFTSEVDSAVRKRVFFKRMIPAEAKKAYAILDAIPVQVVDLPGVRQRAREIAEQFNQKSVYDSTYAALAELRDCEFWTADKAFYDAVKAALPFVKYLADYPG